MDRKIIPQTSLQNSPVQNVSWSILAHIDVLIFASALLLAATVLLVGGFSSSDLVYILGGVVFLPVFLLGIYTSYFCRMGSIY